MHRILFLLGTNPPRSCRPLARAVRAGLFASVSNVLPPGASVPTPAPRSPPLTLVELVTSTDVWVAVAPALGTAGFAALAFGIYLARAEGKLTERMAKLDEKMAGVTKEVDAKMASSTKELDVKLASSTKEVDAKMAGVKEGVDAKMAGLKEGMTKEVDAKMAGSAKEVDAKMAGLKEVVTKEVAGTIALASSEAKSSTMTVLRAYKVPVETN